MIKPIDTVAHAIEQQITGIYGSPPDKGEGHEIARAALRALIDADLSEELCAKALDETEDDGSDRHRWERGHFRAMVSAIVHES